MGYTVPGPPAWSCRRARRPRYLARTLLSHAQPGPPHSSRDQLPPGTGNAHWAAAMLLRSRDAASTSAFRWPKVPPPHGHAPARFRPRIGHASQGSTPSPPAARSGTEFCVRVESRWWVELQTCCQSLSRRRLLEMEFTEGA